MATNANIRGGSRASRATASPRLKYPPYARSLRPLPAPNRSLIVYIGSGAWEEARKQQAGRTGYFVVLPFGDDPNQYNWSFARGSDVLIMPFKEYEPLPAIARLAGLLLAAGALQIVYFPEHGRGSITRFDVRRVAA